MWRWRTCSSSRTARGTPWHRSSAPGPDCYARGLSADERDEERRLSRELVSLATQISKEKEREAPDQSRLNALELELARTRTARGSLQATFYAARPPLKIQRGRADPVALDEAASVVLDTGAAVVEYVVTDQRVLAIALARAGKRPAGTKAQATLPDEAAAPRRYAGRRCG
jgi:hypothetical protein